MKYITLIIGLLVVGCGNSDKVNLLEEENKRLKAEANVKHLEEKLKGAEEAMPTAKPVKELTLREKVVGAYEAKEGGVTMKFVLRDNGIIEAYLNGKKREEEAKWKIVEGQIHLIDGSGNIDVFRINKDGSITDIARIYKDGKREEEPKENQYTLKKTPKPSGLPFGRPLIDPDTGLPILKRR